MNWFKEHLNRTVIITLIVLLPVNFVIGFLGYFFSYFGIGKEATILIITFIVNLVVLLPVSWPSLMQKDKNLLNLLWLIIPSGLLVLFAFLGYITLEALDRAYPSF